MQRITHYGDLAQNENVDLTSLARKGNVITPQEKAAQEFFLIQSVVPKYLPVLLMEEITPDNWLDKLNIIYRAFYLYNLSMSLELRELLDKDQKVSSEVVVLMDLTLDNLKMFTQMLRIPVVNLEVQLALLFILGELTGTSASFYPTIYRVPAKEYVDKLSLISQGSLESLVENLGTMEAISSDLGLLLIHMYLNTIPLRLHEPIWAINDRIDYFFLVLSLCYVVIDKKPQDDFHNTSFLYQEITEVIVKLLKLMDQSKQSTGTGDGREFIEEKVHEAIAFLEKALSQKYALNGNFRIHAIATLIDLYYRAGNREGAYRVVFQVDYIPSLRREYQTQGAPHSFVVNALLKYVELGIEFAPDNSEEWSLTKDRLRLLSVWIREGHKTVTAHADKIAQLKEAQRRRQSK